MDNGLLYQISRLIEGERYGLAHEKLTEILTEFPNSTDAHILRAEAYLREKKYKEAKIAAAEVIQLDPESDHAFYILSRVAIEQDDYKEASSLIEQALMIAPYEASYFAAKAQISLLQRNYKQAVADATEGLELAPDDLDLNNLLSMAYSRLGQSSEAKERLENMMSEDPENPLTHCNMGFHYLQQGDHKQAKEHFAMALRQDPNYDYARMGMMEAMKASNFLYAKLLQFAFWMDRIGSQNRWLFIIGLLVIVNVVPILAPIYLIFILWTWFTGPLSNVILYFDKHGKYLMDEELTKLTQVNTGFLGGVGISILLGFAVDPSFFLLAFACFLSVIPIYMIDSYKKQLSRWVMVGTVACFIGIGLYGIFEGWFLGGSAIAQWSWLIWAAVGFSWVNSALD